MQADGEKTPDPSALVTLVRNKTVGDKMTLVVMRQGRTQEVAVSLAHMPSSQ